MCIHTAYLLLELVLDVGKQLLELLVGLLLVVFVHVEAGDLQTLLRNVGDLENNACMSHCKRV